MLAARYYGIQDIRVEDIPKPECLPGKVLVRVSYAGICGSDLHIYRKGMFVVTVPQTMGHEFCGIVEEVGEGVQGFKVGDHVIADPRVTCGKCQWCQEGAYNLCPELSFIGEICPGSYAEYILMDAEKLIPVPAELDMRRAALVEPMAVALHVIDQGKITENDSVGVIGVGPIGLLTIVAARGVGVKNITAVDISPARLEIAQKVGASTILTSVPEDSTKAVDVVVEAAGREVTLSDAFKWLKPKGRLVMPALYEEPVTIDPNDVVCKELVLTGVNCYNTLDLQKAIDFLLNCSADVEQVITHVLPLSSVNEAFSMLTTAGSKTAKILLAP